MIGAGGVATVAAFKIVQNRDVFTEFMIASRRKEKCDKLVKSIHDKGYKMDIQTAEVDADDVEQLKVLFNSYKPELVINLALPYQDLTIMDACLACGCNYMDTANYEPKDEAHFEYSWQWAYKDKFEKSWSLRYPWLRLRPRCFGHFYCIRCQASLRRDRGSRHRRLQCRQSPQGFRNQLQPRNQHPRDYPERSVV